MSLRSEPLAPAACATLDEPGLLAAVCAPAAGMRMLANANIAANIKTMNKVRMTIPSELHCAKSLADKLGEPAKLLCGPPMKLFQCYELQCRLSPLS
jgi:hypothetical protein